MPSAVVWTGLTTRSPDTTDDSGPHELSSTPQ